MPTYGYQCTECGNAFEIVQKITDDPLKVCDNCNGALQKKIFPVGIAFKGSGFYVNDYAKSSGGASTSAPSSGGEAKTAESAAPAAGGEAKAAETSAAAPAAPAASEAKPAASSTNLTS